MAAAEPLGLHVAGLRLRRPTPADGPMIVAAVRASLEHLRPWMPWATDDYGPRQAQEWISAVTDGVAVALLIVDDDGRRMLGTVGLNRVDGVNRVANLGYWRRPSAGGRGIVTRAAAALVVHAFDALALERVEIRMAVHNAASAAVAERLGAVREGRARRALRLTDRQHDAWLYALVRNDRPRLAGIVDDDRGG